jgi:hypothetical protein
LDGRVADLAPDEKEELSQYSRDEVLRPATLLKMNQPMLGMVCNQATECMLRETTHHYYAEWMTLMEGVWVKGLDVAELAELPPCVALVRMYLAIGRARMVSDRRERKYAAALAALAARAAKKKEGIRITNTILKSFEGDDQCSACREVPTCIEELCTTICYHVFHKECLNKWVDTCVAKGWGVTCPDCRGPIKETKPWRGLSYGEMNVAIATDRKREREREWNEADTKEADAKKTKKTNAEVPQEEGQVGPLVEIIVID